MDKIERERIEKDAIAFSHRSMSDAMFVEVLSPKGCYIAGATAEHDKARNQAIQDCIAKVKGLRNSVGENEYGKTYFDIAYGSVIMELECLKTNQAPG